MRDKLKEKNELAKEIYLLLISKSEQLPYIMDDKAKQDSKLMERHFGYLSELADQLAKIHFKNE